MTTSAHTAQLADVTAAVGPHCIDEYVAAMSSVQTPASQKQIGNIARRFAQKYPTFERWLDEPLEQRLGRLRGESTTPSAMTNSASYQARQYILFSSLIGRLPLPWDYLIMLDLRGVTTLAAQVGHAWLGEHIERLIGEAVARDWSRSAANQGLHFCLPRFALRYADPTYVRRLTAGDFVRFRGEVQDVYATAAPECNTRWQEETGRLGRGALSAGFAAHAIHFQLGLVTDGPKRTRPSMKLITPSVSPAIEEAVGKWLQYDSDRGTPTRSQANNSLHLRYFLTFIAECVPELRDLSELNRAHVLDFLGW